MSSWTAGVLGFFERLNQEENSDFVVLLALNPNFPHPGPQFFSDRLEDQYNSHLVEVRDSHNTLSSPSDLRSKFSCSILLDTAHLKKCGSLTITYDGWSLNGEGYVGVVAHYIKDNALHKRVLGIEKLPPNHTADNYQLCIRKIWRQVGAPVGSLHREQ